MIKRIHYMKKIRLFVLLIGILLIHKSVIYGSNGAQNELKVYEDSLKNYFALLANETNDEKKIAYNKHIVSCFEKVLKNEDSFYYPFYALKNVGIIQSEDYKLRIITWNLPYNDRTYKYFGFIQYKKSKRLYELYELNDNSDKIKNPEFAVLNNKNWYGALYYKIITNKYRGRVYYTLLGADLNNLLSKKKIIDILYFDKNDSPIFGDKVFKNNNNAVVRIIFEFNGQADMTLTYDEEREMIIYDHLSPSKPSLTGEYEFYGPDFSYDGLKFEHGIWNAYLDIDVRNKNIE